MRFPSAPTAAPGTCTNGTAAGSATVTGNGTYPSSAVTVTQAGRYRWIASYSGDPNNNAVSTSCGDAGETRSEERRVGKESRSGSAPATESQTIRDMATRASGVNPGCLIQAEDGIRFHCVAGVQTCALPISAGSATVTGNGTYPSSAVTVTQAGRYRWIASYSGDPNNNAVSTSCGDAGET